MIRITTAVAFRSVVPLETYVGLKMVIEVNEMAMFTSTPNSKGEVSKMVIVVIFTLRVSIDFNRSMKKIPAIHIL